MGTKNRNGGTASSGEELTNPENPGEGGKPPVDEEEYSGPPAGFTDESRPDIDGWLKADTGVVLFGKIVSFFSFVQDMGDGERTREVVCFSLLAPITALLNEEPVRLEKGQILAASMIHCLEPIRAYIEKRGVVWVKFKDKESIGRGKKVWKVEGPFCKGEKSKPVRAAAQAPRAADDDASLPF